MVNGDKTKVISKDFITKNLDQAQIEYEYREINLSKAKEVSDIIMEILIYSSKHSIYGYYEVYKDVGKDVSCEIF